MCDRWEWGTRLLTVTVPPVQAPYMYCIFSGPKTVLRTPRFADWLLLSGHTSDVCERSWDLEGKLNVTACIALTSTAREDPSPCYSLLQHAAVCHSVYDAAAAGLAEYDRQAFSVDTSPVNSGVGQSSAALATLVLELTCPSHALSPSNNS